MDEDKSKIGFDLYNRLTDQSSEIECLFIERTKQLLKDGGVAGIIVPSSILNSSGIQTQTREILLKYFDIIGITELGSNTFMATGKDTVTLFLRRRNNAVAYNIEEAIKKSFVNLQDVTINGIENPITNYLAHVWDKISFDDYKTLMQSNPNEKVFQHEVYQEYRKKIKVKNVKELARNIIALEQEKLFYFLLTYSQKVVLIKTGQKNSEKLFLGYKFSNRRQREGIHPTDENKSIDECTKLYDIDSFTNPVKASTYIYKAYSENIFNLDIPKALKNNISYQNLVDLFDFKSSSFEKIINISPKVKKKLNSKWPQLKIEDILENIKIGIKQIPTSKILINGSIPVITQEKNEFISGYSNDKNPINDLPVIIFGDHSCTFKYIDFPFFRGADGTVLLKITSQFNVKYVYNFLKVIGIHFIENQDKYMRHKKYLNKVMIPNPPKQTQDLIANEIEELELRSRTEVIKDINSEIEKIILNYIV